MVKKILGIAVLVLLAGVVIFNIAELNKEKTQNETENQLNAVNVSGNTSAEGVAIVPPGTAAGIEPGNMAPDFELETLTGETVKLSDLRGKKVIINFWATWCPPCLVEMPEMQKFYEEYQDDVVILAVNTESDTEKVRKFIEEYEYTYPILLDKDMNVSDEYMVSALPTTYFVGTDGKIQQTRKVGPMTYDYMVDMLQSLD